MSQTVIGIFNNVNEAQDAVDQLLSNGFNNEDVDIKSGSSADYTTTPSVKNNTDENKSGFSKFFKNLFNDDSESERYSTAAQRGSVVSVYVQSNEEAQRAANLLDSYGAVDIDDDNAVSDAPNTGNYNMDTNKTSAKANNDGKKLSVIEEKLQVGKREVETGGMRLKSRIVEKPVEESLRLREERVTVQRNKVNRVASDADFNNFQEGTIELTEIAEVPVVSKEARVTEEISLDKEVNERQETIRDTVRHTEVDVEQIDGTDKL